MELTAAGATELMLELGGLYSTRQTMKGDVSMLYAIPVQ